MIHDSLVWLCVCISLIEAIDSYHTGSHAGLPTAEPGHGCRDWHLWWRKGNRAGLGDVGVRRAVVYVVRAVDKAEEEPVAGGTATGPKD